MLGLIVANVRRRRDRTGITAAGIAVGVAAVVALLSLSSGLNRTAAQLIHLGRADLGLFQADAGDPTSSVLPLSLLHRVQAEPWVSQATALQLVTGSVKGSPSAIVFGLDPRGFAAGQLVYTAGHEPGPGQVVVGDGLAGQLHARPGSRIRLGDRSFTVAGVYHSGVAYEDLGAITPLRNAQALAGRSSSEVTTIAVRLKPTVSVAEAKSRFATRYPGVSAISDPGEAIRAGANTQLISKAVFFIVVLALIIGGLAVANTMLGAVLERRRELALLSTIGWSAGQLGVLVLGEALAVSMIGTLVGLVLGLLAAGLLPDALGLANFISADVTAWNLERGALIGVIIGVIGAAYPIWRVTRMWSVVSLAAR
jgi:putative ABC transport system permease protein